MSLGATTRIGVSTLIVLVALFVAGCREAEGATTQSRSAGWSIPSDEAIAVLLAERVERNGVGMVVGVIDGKRRSVVAHGVSGAANGRPLGGATVFQLGSVTKVITSLLLAEMVVRGDVDLDDPVGELLPEDAAMVEVGRPVTLRDLATHTSGLPSMPTNFNIDGEPDPYQAYTVAQLWSFLATFEPERAPGTAYQYSNLGVSLLGRALARKTGATYEALVKERVLEPLGMSSTSITLRPDQRERLASGHDPYLRPIRTWEMATLQASGSLRSSADDMLHLLAAYLGQATPPHVREAVSVQLREGARVDGAFRPLGLGLRPDGTYRHAGGKQGYRSGLAFNPETGAGAIVLANTRTYASEPMLIAEHLVTGESLPPAAAAPADKPRIQSSADELQRFAGLYRSGGGRTWEVVVAEQLLRIRYPNNAILEFVRSGSRDFFYNAGNDDITFEVDAEGRVVGLTVYGDGRAEGGGEFAARIATR